MGKYFRQASVSAPSTAVRSRLLLRAYVGMLMLGLMLSNLTLIAPTSAAMITVGNAGDPATGDPSKCNVANTCTLRDAIARAANVTGATTGDTIVFNLPANSMITLSGNQLFVDRNLIIDGGAFPGISISGNNQSRIVEIATDVIATLKQLTIRGGKSTEGGAGIYNRGILTLVNNTVTSNEAVYSGGGGILNDYNASLTLSGSLISGNTAYSGGGIINLSGSLKLTGSTVESNVATSDGGGGILNTSGSLLLTNVIVSRNSALGGGGIENYSGTVTLTSSTISDNALGGIANYYGIMTATNCTILRNTGRSGGGILNNAIMTLIRSTISKNIATDGNGGGIYNGSYGILTLMDSTVHSNTAFNGNAWSGGTGGGISSSSFGPLTLVGSTIHSNTAEILGGGIEGNSVKLINSTISGNKARHYGGGLATYDLTSINGTLAGNSVEGISEDIYLYDGISRFEATNTIIQRCVIYRSSTTTLIDNGGNLDGGVGCGFTKINSKPNARLALSALTNNGGPTLTMIPSSNSDAIGRGEPSACIGALINSRDQRGYVRPTIGCTSGAVDPNGSANNSIFLDGFGFGGQ